MLPLLAGKAKDFVIIVVGITGAGKSTFINHSLGVGLQRKHVQVGPKDSVHSCTKRCHFVELEVPNNLEILPKQGPRRLVLVDTPGLNNSDGSLSDDAIMKQVLGKVKKSYGAGVTGVGFIYLYDLSASPGQNSVEENLELLAKYWGKDAFRRTVVMTSHWGSIPREKMQEATRRERELKIKFGNERLEDCVRYIPFDPADHQTAWKALRTILCQYDRDLSGNDAALILGPQPNDSIILVTGLSGAGKSSLINHILGPNSKQKVKVGNQLEGCTQDVHAICTDMPVQLSHLLGEGDSGRLVLVDTPAFDGAYEGEMVTLTRVANWLARSAPMTVRGVIYVHDMSESRITGSMRRYLWTLEKLCGEEMFGKLVIVTSKWDSVRPRESQGHLSPSQVGEERVEVFKMRAWNELINGGAIVRNFHPANQAQALEIVKLVLTNRSGVEDVPLAVQREIIVEGRELRQTSAAKGLLQGIHNNLDADVSSKVWFDKKIKQFWRV